MDQLSTNMYVSNGRIWANNRIADYHTSTMQISTKSWYNNRTLERPDYVLIIQYSKIIYLQNSMNMWQTVQKKKIYIFTIEQVIVVYADKTKWPHFAKKN